MATFQVRVVLTDGDWDDYETLQAATQTGRKFAYLACVVTSARMRGLERL